MEAAAAGLAPPVNLSGAAPAVKAPHTGSAAPPTPPARPGLGLCWNEAECPQPQQKHPHGFKLLVQSCRVPQKINKHMLERQREVSGGSYSESHGRSGGLG